ncbi:hypothetical protein [Nocardia cyriacigeorgica]|uniref:hypothetical protein n=1 Tax=Nocardia cyriacigeorgica TaxID=135487 RepID=UPI0013D15BD8|nr:hypothetical protein [Nocardia cyriacigeorgica]MBF6434824.1 hypothetical protein [Nocardia cyriacigeorgica]MBF6455092.1 hypothetical protein [Nocardia cyriacigeorgica]MBF6479329.1 hypothetical protein [Nocardia cyriacigeorgica]MBF6552987.1 hypothetical protein [Nocardia cyriacigeorgica]NEW26784.1 hypothetical protein [Nocardia cyriacigeorgica]
MIAAVDRVDVLADHSVLLAVPAFAPAFVVVGIIVFIAVRDRRAEKRENGPETTPTQHHSPDEEEPR